MAIAQGNTSSTNNTAQSSITLEHIIASGSNRLLLVWVSVANGEDLPSGITYDGDSLTLKGANDVATAPDAVLYFMIAPNVGTANIVVTWAVSATFQTVCAVDYTDVDQSTPLGTLGTEAAAFASTESITMSSAIGELVIAAAQHNNADWTDDDTAVVNDNRSGVGMHVGSEAGASSVTINWTKDAGSGWVASFGVPVKPAAVPSGIVVLRRRRAA